MAIFASPRRQLDMETCASKIRVYTGADGRPKRRSEQAQALLVMLAWNDVECCEWLVGTNSIHIAILMLHAICCMLLLICNVFLNCIVVCRYPHCILRLSSMNHMSPSAERPGLCSKRPLFLLLSISAISGWNMFEPVELDLFFPTPIQPYHNLSPLRKCKIFIFAQQEILHSCMC